LGPTTNIVTTANTGLNVTLFKNGVAVSELGEYRSSGSVTVYVFASGSTTVSCVSGDTLEIRASQNTGATFTSSGDYVSSLSITKLGVG
jgi:hypothetical protein